MAMMFSMSTILAPLSGGLGSLSFRIPLQAIPVIGIGVVLMALFVAAGMMILASFARNFKEGQSMVSPFYLIIILPVMFLQAPGTEFTHEACADSGRQRHDDVSRSDFRRLSVAADWHHSRRRVRSASLLGLKIATTILSHEDVVTGSYSGSFGKFFKQRLLRR